MSWKYVTYICAFNSNIPQPIPIGSVVLELYTIWKFRSFVRFPKFLLTTTVCVLGVTSVHTIADVKPAIRMAVSGNIHWLDVVAVVAYFIACIVVGITVRLIFFSVHSSFRQQTRIGENRKISNRFEIFISLFQFTKKRSQSSLAGYFLADRNIAWIPVGRKPFYFERNNSHSVDHHGGIIYVAMQQVLLD